MLHYARVMQALASIKDELFIDVSKQIQIARASWQRIIKDPDFQTKAQVVSSPWLIPTWYGPVDATYSIEPMHEPYIALSVDGSQIYPDRHQGTGCYLINIGKVELRYGTKQHVIFDSVPYVFAGREEDEADERPMDLVNAKRQELELRVGLECYQSSSDEVGHQVFLFDGSLICWHLASRTAGLKDRYIARYLGLMHQLYTKRILHGGYISLPKSKELVNLLRIELCGFEVDGCQEHKAVDQFVDTTIASFYLEPGQRTAIFKSNASICALYPDHLAPHFFYLHVGQEIARIEIPAWISQDHEMVTLVARVMFDQAQKGNGYPVALAEAHEQAVVKGPDREFFYQLITKMAIEHKKHMFSSAKSSKKRTMNV